MSDLIRNSKKPILGLLAGAVVWIAAHVGLDVDANVAAAIAGAVYAAVVRIVEPVFGIPSATPEYTKDGALKRRNHRA